MATLLWIIAVVLVISGVVALLRRQLIWGIVLIMSVCSSDPVG